MKIKQVCEQTGLTARAVRFYCERGLVHPAVYSANARNYYEFSSENVQMLRRICILRQADFSLDEIEQMMRAPQQMMAVVRSHMQRLAGQAHKTAAILRCLQALEIQAPPDFNAFADALLLWRQQAAHPEYTTV